MTWSIQAAIVVAGVLVAASILLTDHWQISAIGYGRTGDYASESVYRLNRWSGAIEHCVLVADAGLPKTPNGNPTGTVVRCPAPAEVPYNATPGRD